jgi:hypothetical protein
MSRTMSAKLADGHFDRLINPITAGPPTQFNRKTVYTALVYGRSESHAEMDVPDALATMSASVPPFWLCALCDKPFTKGRSLIVCACSAIASSY